MTTKFQQRHFEDLAQLMADVRPCATSKSETREEYRESIIRAMCDLFKRDNPHFNEDRFRVACRSGVTTASRRVGPAMPYVQPRN